METKRKSYRFGQLRLVFSLLLVLTFVVAALPQQRAQAAVTCVTYYWFKEGDTTPYIAHTFGLKWKEIALANDMDPWDKPEVGQRLCIPAPNTTTTTTKKTGTSEETTSGVRVEQPADEDNAVISASISGYKITVSTNKFVEDHIYLVKVRDVKVGVGGWTKLGTISVDKKTSQTFSFTEPSDLKQFTHLSVCLKDQVTNELICRTAVNF
jgi:LysM repeat protein